MNKHEFEDIKQRVEAGTTPDGHFKAGLSGNAAQAAAARDLRRLLEEVERLRKAGS